MSSTERPTGIRCSCRRGLRRCPTRARSTPAGSRPSGSTTRRPTASPTCGSRRTQRGQPTGRLRGAVTTNYNTDPFFREILLKLPPPSSDLVAPATLAAITAHHAHGITAVYEPHAMEARHISVYRRLRDAGRLTMRVKAVPEYQRFTRPNDPVKSLDELARTLRDALVSVDIDDAWVRSEGITVSVTGTCAPGNMRWPTPYLDAFGHETSGRWFVSEEAVDQAARFSATNGLQLGFCSMGPSEHELFLDAVERHGVRGGVVQHGAIMPIGARASLGRRRLSSNGVLWVHVGQGRRVSGGVRRRRASRPQSPCGGSSMRG